MYDFLHPTNHQSKPNTAPQTTVPKPPSYGGRYESSQAQVTAPTAQKIGDRRRTLGSVSPLKSRTQQSSVSNESLLHQGRTRLSSKSAKVRPRPHSSNS